MIQTIGLIVAVYAILRCVTIPLEMAVSQDSIAGVTPAVRYVVACVSCVISLVVIGVLTLLLLFSGAEFPKP